MPIRQQNPNISTADAPAEETYLNNPPKIYFQNNNPNNEIQLETMDSEIGNLKLFKQPDESIELDKFLVRFGSQLDEGVDPYKTGFKSNFNLPSFQFLGLLHNKSLDVNLMDEVIEDNVNSVVHDIEVDDIIEFQKDWEHIYKTMKDPSKLMDSALFYLQTNQFPFMKKLKLKLTTWMLNNPPYGHPVFSPNKKIKYID